MKVRLTNPLMHPTAVIIGGVLLVAGSWFGRIPPKWMIPISIAVTSVTAIGIRSFNPTALEQDLESLPALYDVLKEESNQVRSYAGQALEDPDLLELQVQIVGLCDWAEELPRQIDVQVEQILKQPQSQTVQSLESKIQSLTPGSSIDAERQQLAQQLRITLDQIRAGEEVGHSQILTLIGLVNSVIQALQQVKGSLRGLSPQMIDPHQVSKAVNQFQSLQERFSTILS